MLQNDWIRITQNPNALEYPKTGDTIELKGHQLLNDGKYIVTMVEEFEPAYHADESGRDIRLTLINSNNFSQRHTGMNGQNILRAINGNS